MLTVCVINLFIGHFISDNQDIYLEMVQDITRGNFS